MNEQHHNAYISKLYFQELPEVKKFLYCANTTHSIAVQKLTHNPDQHKGFFQPPLFLF